MTRRDVCLKCFESMRQQWRDDPHANQEGVDRLFAKDRHLIDEGRCAMNIGVVKGDGGAPNTIDSLPVQDVIDRWPESCPYLLELVVAEAKP
jgi:hypothetical protein